MIILKITNKHVEIVGADRKTIFALEKATSFMVSGAYYSEAFRLKRWDGREHLLKFSNKRGYNAPIGLLEDIISTLKTLKKKYKIDDSGKRKQTEFIEYNWNEEIVLRKYQKKGVKKITAPGLFKGVGILNYPIRSGKTKTAAGVIHKLKARTLFIVTAKNLLYQSKESLEHSLGVEVGIIGDGVWEEKDVTVAMAQTLTQAKGGRREYICEKTKKKRYKVIKTDPRFKALIGKYDLVLFDECHHLTSTLWHNTLLDFDAPYRIGLSATVYFENETEYEKGVIWLKACCGNIRYKISTSFLIKNNFLMKPIVKIYTIDRPSGIYEMRWSQDLYRRSIHLNKYRNKKICFLANKYVRKGMKVLIVAKRIEQVEELSRMLDRRKVPHNVITGAASMDERGAKVEEFTSGERPALIGTVFSEGVDIPEIEVVINAEGGKDVKMTVQKMRNLTPHNGKTKAIYIDFLDLMNPYFEKHSNARLGVYNSEPAFTVKMVNA